MLLCYRFVRLSMEVGCGTNDSTSSTGVDERACRRDRKLGDPTKAKRELGWAATTSFGELVSSMVQAEVDRNEHGSAFGVDGEKSGPARP
jgi:GDP-D-mannose dehydratase